MSMRTRFPSLQTKLSPSLMRLTVQREGMVLLAGAWDNPVNAESARNRTTLIKTDALHQIGCDELVHARETKAGCALHNERTRRAISNRLIELASFSQEILR